MRRAALLAALVLAGCDAGREPDLRAAAPDPAPSPPKEAQSPPTPAPEPAQASDDWRRYARPDDRDRLSRLDAAWSTALAEARAGGHGAELAALGALADPTAALPVPQPAPGAYRCRTVKLGSRGEGTLPFVAYPWFRCRVELTPGGDLTLAKQTGSQRATGQLYPGEERRLVFLGAVAWGSDEASAPAYGQDPERDQIGVLQRIGEERYRLALPWPRQESDLDLLELQRTGN